MAGFIRNVVLPTAGVVSVATGAAIYKAQNVNVTAILPAATTSATGAPTPKSPPTKVLKLHGAPLTDEQTLEAALNALPKGSLAYTTPGKMRTSETAHITARIGSDSVTVQALQSGMTQKVEIIPLPVSLKMRMVLRGADFEITPVNTEEQFVAGDTPTTWEWDIVPKRSGQLRLHLAAVVLLNNLSRDFTVVDRDISVQVDPVDEVEKFVKKNWQWIIATLTAVFGAMWKFFSDRKKKKRHARVAATDSIAS
jgi:hypothetical protein